MVYSRVSLIDFLVYTTSHMNSIRICPLHRLFAEGPSGVGKSVLAHRLGRSIGSQNGIFLSGKFDQLKQSTPFSAVAAAFNQYCDLLANEGETERSKRVTSKLISTLGKDGISHLVKVIPSLGKIILPQDGGQQTFDQDSCVNPLERLLYLMCQFVQVISSSSGVPVTIFLDDCQWVRGHIHIFPWLALT